MVMVCSSCMVCGAPSPPSVSAAGAQTCLGFSGLVPAGEVSQPGVAVAAVEDGAEPARALGDGAAEPVAGVGGGGGAEPDVVGDGGAAVAGEGAAAHGLGQCRAHLASPLFSRRPRPST